MPSNITQDTLPYYWCSANDDVIYTFSFNPYVIDSIANDGGNVSINLQNDFDIQPVPGEYIYVLSDVYVGTYKVISSSGTSQATIDLAYVSGITSNVYNCYHLRLPVFSVYKGFKSGETYDVNLPYTKVVDLKPSVKYDSNGFPSIEINIKGITKYLFTIIPNTVANSIDFSMFNAVRLSWDGLETINNVVFAYTLVLNSAITNAELQYKYIGEGIQLLPIDKVLIPTSGVGFVSVINGLINDGFPTLLKFIDGNQV